MEKVQENFFLWVGFLLGSVGILYGKTFHYFLLLDKYLNPFLFR